MQLIGMLFCFCVLVQNRASEIENSFQESGGGDNSVTSEPLSRVFIPRVIISSELGYKPESPPTQDSDTGNEVMPAPGPLAQLLNRAARTNLEQSTSEQGASELPHITGRNQTTDGDTRSKRSPHRYRKGCFSCGYGGGGYYVQPVYVQPVFVKTVEYVPVYRKPFYPHPHYSTGCPTCGHWGGGGGSGSFAYSQSSASSSSYSYGYGKK